MRALRWKVIILYIKSSAGGTQCLAQFLRSKPRRMAHHRYITCVCKSSKVAKVWLVVGLYVSRATDGWRTTPIYYLQARPPLAKVTKLKKSGWLLVCNSGHSCTDELLTGFQLRVAYTLYSMYHRTCKSLHCSTDELLTSVKSSEGVGNYSHSYYFDWWFAWMSYWCLLGEENRQPFLCLFLLKKKNTVDLTHFSNYRFSWIDHRLWLKMYRGCLGTKTKSAKIEPPGWLTAHYCTLWMTDFTSDLSHTSAKVLLLSLLVVYSLKGKGNMSLRAAPCETRFA